MRLHRVIGAEHAPEELAGERQGDGRGPVRHLAPELARRLEQDLRCDDARHESPRERLVGGEDARRVDPLGRALHPDEPREEPAAARLGDDAPAGEDEAHPATGRGKAHVHRERHGDPDPDGRAVDRGDDGLPGLEDAERHEPAAVAVRVHRLPARIVEGPAAAGEIRPRAEGPSRPGHDDDAHRIVGVGALEGVEQLVHHARGEGVQLLRAMERDGEEPVVDRVADLLVVHGGPQASTGRSSKSRCSAFPPSSSAIV